MSEPGEAPDRRWPRSVYGTGSEPDPRFSFANERTFLAAGVGISAVARLSTGLTLETRAASLVLIACGLGCGIGAWSRWVGSERAMRENRPLPSSPLLLVLVGVVVVVAVIALVAVSLVR